LRRGSAFFSERNSICGIAATAIKGGTLEALTAGTAFMGAAAAWGYTSKPKV
jgi:hypothetical protein